MSKKGFTLLELLAVIIILGVVALITIPRINEAIMSARLNAMYSNNDAVVKAAQTYLVSNDSLIRDIQNDIVVMNIDDLINEGHLSSIKDPFSSEFCGGYVLATRNDNNTFITPQIRCGDNITSIDEDGIFAYYPFLEQHSDNLVQDISPNSNHISVSSSFPTFTKGARENRNAYYFNGSSIINTNLNFSIDGDYSVALWAKLSDDYEPSNHHRLIGTNSWQSGRFGIVVTEFGKISANTYFGSGYDYWQHSNIDAVPGEWFHVVLTINRNGYQSFYYNGTLVSRRDISSASHIDWNQDEICMSCGGAAIGVYRRFDGYLDDVMIFDRVLSRSEVAAIYSNSKL